MAGASDVGILVLDFGTPWPALPGGGGPQDG
jgi:hypothetical protein